MGDEHEPAAAAAAAQPLFCFKHVPGSKQVVVRRREQEVILEVLESVNQIRRDRWSRWFNLRFLVLTPFFKVCEPVELNEGF